MVDTKGTFFQTQQDLCIYELIEITAAYTRPEHIQARGVPILSGEVDMSSHPQPRSYLQLTSTHSGKISFSKGLTLGTQTTCKGEPHSQHLMATQNELKGYNSLLGGCPSRKSKRQLVES
jgi:hypothetical protein